MSSDPGPFDGPFMGDFPGRPDHPDFWALSDVVLQHDGKATEDPNFDMAAHIATVLDPESLRYMVQQRVRRHLDTTGPLLSMPGGEQLVAETLYLDAFMLGAAFAQQHPKETS